MSRTDTQVVQDFWHALYARNWDAIPGFFTDDALYFDVPAGPAAGAVGGDGIVKRLKLGLAELSEYTHHQKLLIGDADGNVVTEHSEDWTFPTGESFTIEFVSVMKVVDGKIHLWKDYWDYRVWVEGVPPGLPDQLAATGDLSFLPTPEQLAAHGY